MKKVIKFLVFKLLAQPLFFGGVALFLVSCSSQSLRSDNADEQFNYAEKAYQDEDYLVALEAFRDVKNRFPYSQKAVEAELRIADTYFSQESYIEAEAAYEVFKELHPTHSKADYVQYQIGLSYFNQIPDNIARDLSAAQEALSAFDQLEKEFPDSKYTELAKAKTVETQSKLAEHEQYVANFYYQRHHYLSSSYRYASLLRKYPNSAYQEEALYRLGECYYHINRLDEAKEMLEQLNRLFPQSLYQSEAADLQKKLTEKNG